MGQALAVLALEADVYVRIRKVLVEERRARISDLDPVLGHPGDNHHQRAGRQHSQRAQHLLPLPYEFPGDESQRVRHRQNRGVLHRVGETREQPDGNEQRGRALPVPDLEQIEEHEQHAGHRHIQISGAPVKAHHRAEEHEQRPRDARQRKTKPAPVGQHRKRQSGQEGEVNQRRGRMPPERERVQEKHFRALRQVGVHVRGDAIEAVRQKVAGNQAQMVAAPVGADLGSHRVEEVEVGEQREERAEQQLPIAL